MMKYVKIIEKIQILRKQLEDYNTIGLQKNGLNLENDIENLVVEIPQFQFMFLNPQNRVSIHKFSLWLISMLNHLDKHHPSLTYIMPEITSQIPFEIFRAFKRGSIPLYETES